MSMTVDSQQGLSLVGDEDDPAKKRKHLEAGLVGPAQGCGGLLQSDTTPVALTLSQPNPWITITPPEVCIEMRSVREGGR